MSVQAQRGGKVELKRLGSDEFWRHLQNDYAGENRYRWRSLAMLVLREEGGWPIERIGRAFDLSTGHVSRALKEIKFDLNHFLETAPSWDYDDELITEEA